MMAGESGGKAPVITRFGIQEIYFSSTEGFSW